MWVSQLYSSFSWLLQLFWVPWVFPWILRLACQFLPKKKKITWDSERNCVECVHQFRSTVILKIVRLPIHKHGYPSNLCWSLKLSMFCSLQCRRKFAILLFKLYQSILFFLLLFLLGSICIFCSLSYWSANIFLIILFKDNKSLTNTFKKNKTIFCLPFWVMVFSGVASFWVK